MYGRDSIIQLLLENGVDLNDRNNNNRTVLHWAAMHGHETTTKLLLGGGVDIGARDDCEQTALHWAAMDRHKLWPRCSWRKELKSTAWMNMDGWLFIRMQ